VLRPYADGDLKSLVLRALALGWSEKWRTPSRSPFAGDARHRQHADDEQG
jgi:hypothetical protein